MQSERLGPKGTVLPTTCKIGDSFILVDRTNTLATFHVCLTDNVWTAVFGNDVTLSPAITL